MPRRIAAVVRTTASRRMRAIIVAACVLPLLPVLAADPNTPPAATPASQPAPAELVGDTPPTGAIWLDSLDVKLGRQDYGEPHAGLSVDRKPITLRGQVFTHGIGTHAGGALLVDLRGVATRFRAVVGVDDEATTNGSVNFEVWVDDRLAAATEVLRGGGATAVLDVDLTGAKHLALVVESGGDDIDHDHADWAGALLMLNAGATERPATIPLPAETEPPIARGTKPEPAIHGPRITGATPGKPFLFLIPATGEGPLKYAARGLPRGLTLDPNTGIISGELAAAGKTDVELTVTGPKGTARRTLTIVGGEHQLALTPPMGWNSWNCWAGAVDDAKVRAAADWMVKSGLAAHGYQYINIDDTWEARDPARDPNGVIQTNERFPDMTALAEYVHSKGLKLGIYSSPGPKTCAGFEGSYGHEQQDADTYATWGIDLLKYDWCGYSAIAPDPNLAQLKHPYAVMRTALDHCGRDIVYSLCQYGMGHVSEWGAAVGGNYWRTTGDIGDSWGSMSGIGFGQDGLEQYAGPGHWNDPDMLVVGKLGWGEHVRPTKLTPNEALTHITLWTLLAAPMLLGCDLAQLDDFTRALLTNDEVIAVHQDPLGKQAHRVTPGDSSGGSGIGATDRDAANGAAPGGSTGAGVTAGGSRAVATPADGATSGSVGDGTGAGSAGGGEVWARPLSDGTQAVGLFNRSELPGKVTIKWRDLGLSGSQPVRDLWQQRDLTPQRDPGLGNDGYTVEVPRHSAVLIKVGAPPIRG